MRLGEFHQMVSAELKRGSSLDAVIPSKVRQAVRFLERNAPMKHMETWFDLVLDRDDQLAQFPWQFRHFRWMRYKQITSDGFLYLKSVNGEDLFPWDDYSVPMSYLQIGYEAIRFNRPAPDRLALEGVVYKFTDWQTTQPQFSHFLLTNAEDLLLHQTLITMAVYLKDARMLQFYKPLRDESLKALFAMDQEAEENGKNEQMVYGGF